METLKTSESKSCEVSLGLSEVQLPQIPGIQKLVTDFCPPVAELVLRVNSPVCRFDPLAKKFSSVRFPRSTRKESIVTVSGEQCSRIWTFRRQPQERTNLDSNLPWSINSLCKSLGAQTQQSPKYVSKQIIS